MKPKLAAQVRSFTRLEAAWLVIRENARTSRSVDIRQEVEKFSVTASSGLRSISSRISRGSFRFEPAEGVPIPKRDAKGRPKPGKIRPIVLAPLESRIVQRSILDVLCGVPALDAYVNTPYSFGGIKKADAALGAVPAAVQAVLGAIRDGAKYVAFADIRSFFTRIEKNRVSSIISGIVSDDEFMDLFQRAIKVELKNMGKLRGCISMFPIEDIGVAQGNSLSPLLGNIVLHDFDLEMNRDWCWCIRYIDDFIVLGPSVEAVREKMKVAIRILEGLGMELSPEKSSAKPKPISDAFTFLGIEMANGLVRPSRGSRTRLLAAVEREFAASEKAFARARRGEAIDRSMSLSATLKRVDGIVNGWGKHYRFCNDAMSLRHMDAQISDLVQKYTKVYGDFLRRASDDSTRRRLLGVQLLGDIPLSPLLWPKS